MNENCDLHAIIDNCLTILNSRIKYGIKLTKEYTTELFVIKGNVGKLHQVFLNILTNAIQAVNENGKIKVKTRKDNKKLLVEIIDSGTGISKENLNRVTDPFFTTKAPGTGTGLGLSISYNIITEHNGKLEFESEPGKGTKVLVSFQTA